MKRRNFTILICCAMLLCILSGCQLAHEYIWEHEAKLIGVLITRDYPDLPLGADRLYAVQFTKTRTSEETGEIFETEEFVFSILDGIPYFSPVVAATSEHEGDLGRNSHRQRSSTDSRQRIDQCAIQ